MAQKRDEARAPARERALASRRARKDDTRRKILIGEVVLAQVDQGVLEERLLRTWLDATLTHADDRELFNLPVGGEGEPQTSVRVDSSAEEARMAILLKIRWEIKAGREREFRDNQEKLCAVMRAEHPGVICYHVDYPSMALSEWTEIYANNEVFKAHLANRKGQQPLQTLITLCDDIACRCWGDPDAQSQELLADFETAYKETAAAAYVLHPHADPKSKV